MPDDTTNPSSAGDASAEGEPPAPPAVPEPTDDAAPAPASGDSDPAPESGAESGASDPLTDVPEVPADLESADEAELRSTYTELGEVRTSRLDAANEAPNLAQRAADLLVLEAVEARRTAIRTEIERRGAETLSQQERLEAIAAGDVDLPAPTPAFASAAAVVGAREAQPPAVQEAPVPEPTRPRAVMLASANAGYAADEEIDLAQLGQAVERTSRSGYGFTRIASISAYEHMGADDRGALPELLSMDNGAIRNDRLIAEAQEDWKARQAGLEPPARTAAICEPFDIIREIPDAFSAAERVSPIFPSRPMGRLGFQFTRSMVLADMATGSDIWTEDDQAAVDSTDPDTWKPCVDVDCPTPTPAHAEAVTFCMRFDNTTEMSVPERIANATNTLMAVKARNKEGYVLRAIDALSSGYSFIGEYGALPALIQAVNTIVAQAVFNERIDEPNYVMLVPPGVQALLAIDRANRAYNPNGIESANVLSELQAGLDGVVSVVETLDASLAGEPGLPFAAFNAVNTAADPLPTLENDYRIRLVDPSQALYSETGELYVGTYRSVELMRQNKAIYLGEEFLVLAKNGPKSWFYIDVGLCANGARAGLVEPYDCPAVS